MKLLVIVLCLLSERYLVHAGSHYRRQWFSIYLAAMTRIMAERQLFSSPWFALFMRFLPLILVVFLSFVLFAHHLFGLIGLLLNIAIFYFCLGPDNVFYPVCDKDDKANEKQTIADYLVNVNQQLFAPMVWYILLGPMAVLMYRLVFFCQEQAVCGPLAGRILLFLDWLSTRVAALFYLLVGNFQAGKGLLLQWFFKEPAQNQALLSACGLQALGSETKDSPTFMQAEQLVLHAMVALLVLLACFTLVAWM